MLIKAIAKNGGCHLYQRYCVIQNTKKEIRMKYFTKLNGFLLEFDDLSNTPSFSVDCDCGEAKIYREKRNGQLTQSTRDEIKLIFKNGNSESGCSSITFLFNEDFSLVGLSCSVNGVEVRREAFDSFTVRAKEGVERKVREEILNRAIKYNESKIKQPKRPHQMVFLFAHVVGPSRILLKISSIFSSENFGNYRKLRETTKNIEILPKTSERYRDISRGIS